MPKIKWGELVHFAQDWGVLTRDFWTYGETADLLKYLSSDVGQALLLDNSKSGADMPSKPAAPGLGAVCGGL